MHGIMGTGFQIQLMHHEHMQCLIWQLRPGDSLCAQDGLNMLKDVCSTIKRLRRVQER
jgi:hypothetical protein